MGFRINSYATVFSVEPGRGNFTKCRISISRRDRNTGEYVQDFGGYVMMIGPAHAKAQNLKERDRIQLKEIDVSNRYVKEQNREYVDYKCFDFEMAELPGARSQAAQSSEPEALEGDEEPPF